MDLISWKPAYSVGNKTMDDQHQVLVGMLNELFDHMAKGKGPDQLEKTFDQMTRYARSHFSDEEMLMARYGYKELEQHKKEHHIFAARINELRFKFMSGNKTMAIEVVNFLKEWLLNHICGTDQKYSSLLKDK